MNTTIRRCLIAVGAALLVGGCGATRYAEKMFSRDIYVTGVVGMAIGAGLIGLAWLPIDKQKRHGQDTNDTDKV